MKKSYTIFIVDDHQLFSDGIQNIIEKNDLGVVKATLKNGKMLFLKLNSEVPDLVILDINMPEMDGFEVAKKLQSNYPEVKIVVISMKEERSTILRMKQFGVKGYLSKLLGVDELIEAITAIKNDILFFPILDKFSKFNTNNNKIQFTDGELRVVHCLTEGNSSKEIADKLNLSIHTVNTHRKNILRKTEQKSTVSLVSYLNKTDF